MDFTELEAAGVDIATLKERLMNNEALITRFMNRFVENESYRALKAAIKASDWKSACEASHMLKGMCGNLSITELFRLFTQQVNLFRSGDNEMACLLMTEIDAKYESTMNHIHNWLSE